MAKPLSRPNEIGRAIGYRVDVSLLLAWLKQEGEGRDSADEMRASWLQDLERTADLHTAGGRARKSRKLWVVVKSERGVPVLLDAFRDKRSANARAKFLRLHMSQDLDTVELHLVPLDA